MGDARVGEVVDTLDKICDDVVNLEMRSKANIDKVSSDILSLKQSLEKFVEATNKNNDCVVNLLQRREKNDVICRQTQDGIISAVASLTKDTMKIKDTMITLENAVKSIDFSIKTEENKKEIHREEEAKKLELDRDAECNALYITCNNIKNEDSNSAIAAFIDLFECAQCGPGWLRSIDPDNASTVLQEKCIKFVSSQYSHIALQAIFTSTGLRDAAQDLLRREAQKESHRDRNWQIKPWKNIRKKKGNYQSSPYVTNSEIDRIAKISMDAADQILRQKEEKERDQQKRKKDGNTSGVERETFWFDKISKKWYRKLLINGTERYLLCTKQEINDNNLNNVYQGKKGGRGGGGNKGGRHPKAKKYVKPQKYVKKG